MNSINFKYKHEEVHHLPVMSIPMMLILVPTFLLRFLKVKQ